MNQSIKRLGWTLPGVLLLCSIASTGQTTSTSINGRWEVDGVPSGPWVFDLSVADSGVTGRVMQHGGIPGPSEIYSGKLDGDVLTFKTRGPIVSAAAKEITFTGRVTGNDILFERTVEILLNGPNDGTQPADRGVFGTTGPARFTARRFGPIPVPAIASNPTDATRLADVNGKWESLRWNLDVWSFDLKSVGNQLSGTVSMTAGPGRQPLVNSQPLAIFDGRIEGNTVHFKSKSPDNVRTIAFTGKVQGDEIAFVRSVEVPPGGATGFEAVYGVFAPMSFLAKRAPSNTPAENTIVRDLQQAQKTWAARTFISYEFTAQWRCFCPLPTQPLTYRGSGSAGAVGLNPAIAALIGVPPEAVRPVLERYATFDQIFAFLSAAAARQPHLLKIDYDPMLGYPTKFTLHPGGTSADEDIEFRVFGFRILN